ncbi:serine hydroxymethyltransferase [Acrasis kona]
MVSSSPIVNSGGHPSHGVTSSAGQNRRNEDEDDEDEDEEMVIHDEVDDRKKDKVKTEPSKEDE